MVFAGIKSKGDRQDLIAYLKASTCVLVFLGGYFGLLCVGGKGGRGLALDRSLACWCMTRGGLAWLCESFGRALWGLAGVGQTSG